MKTDNVLKRVYWKWEESPIRNLVHWMVFFSVGIVVVIHLVSSITASAVENGGFGIYSSSPETMIDES